MKSQSWLKKALNIYIFNLVLLVGQLTAIGGSLPAYAEEETLKTFTSQSSAERKYPPGYTAEDYAIVAARNKAAEENFARERDRNVGVKNVEKDISSSECRTYAANDARRMTDLTTYRVVTGSQGYDEICNLRQRLNSQTGGPRIECGNGLELVGDSSSINRDGQLSSAESKYNTNVTNQTDGFDTEKLDEGRIAVNKRLDTAKAEEKRLSDLVPQKKQAYESARHRCEDDGYAYCTRAERNEIEALKNEYYASVQGLRKAVQERKAAKKAWEDYGKDVTRQEGKVLNAEAEMEQNDQNQKQSDALSGIENTATGEGGGLTGPVYETNEALKEAIDRYTSNAAAFAEEKIAEASRLEFLNTNKGDYEFYELALKDIDPNTRGGKLALSNLDVTAMASSSIKKLRCNPKRKHDSKAYHIFRAASATYIAASIGDNKSYNEMMGCIEKEVFNEDENNDEQFEAAEKALNSHTLIVDTMCTAVAPDPNNIPQLNGQDILPRERVEKLKQICDASAGVTCAPGQETGCAPRTKETALEMYQTALMIAQQELGDKRQLVATAEANVEKGKKKIAATKKSIAIAIALDILWKIIAQTDLGTGLGMNASSPPCFCAGMGFVAKSFWDNAKAAFFYAKYLYYGIQLKRWTAYTKKWEKKLEEAREHTHLACNYDEALSMEGKHKTFAEKTKKEAIKAHNAAKESVLNSINKDNLGAMGKTGFLILPKGISNEDKTYIVEFYLKKYMKVVGSTAMNLVFPNAFAANSETGSNTETATDSTMSDTTNSAKALGMTMGSSSFYQFVISQNDHWKEQAYDADGAPGSGYVRNDNPIMYCDHAQGGSGNCIKPEIVGMPTPETRVRLITNAVEMVSENISGMLEHLDQSVDHRDKYVQLLNQMREAMKLQEKGLDMQHEQKPVMKAASCMKKGTNGDFEIDQGCQCQETGTCASLQYGNFGEFTPGVIADSADSIKKYSDASLSGNLKEANVASGEMSKTSNAVRRKIRKSFNEMNKLRKKNGQDNLNYADASRDSIQKRREASFTKYKKLFPSEYKFEKVSGGLASFYGNLDNPNTKTAVRKSPLLASTRSSKPKTGSGAGIGKGGKGSIEDKQKGIDFTFDDGTYYDGENVAEGGNSAGGLGGAGEEYATDAGEREYGHVRSVSFDQDGTGISKDTKKSIFKIITGRYIKTAYPVLLNKKSRATR